MKKTMLKMILADDERIVRETILKIIDWESEGIEIVGLCKDGIEAYDLIQDENPDIVLTDIRMPGLTGLDLVGEAFRAGLHTQFIILSGYDEFEYARKAMEYGVKYYLLKPCTREQVAETARKITADCLRLQEQLHNEKLQSTAARALFRYAMYNIVLESAGADFSGEKTLRDIIDRYDSTVGFADIPCALTYVYYIEPEDISLLIQDTLQETGFWEKEISYGFYVNHTLMLISRDSGDIADAEKTIPGIVPGAELKTRDFCDFYHLFDELIPRVSRYETIFAIQNGQMVKIYNHDNFLSALNRVWKQTDTDAAESVAHGLAEVMRIAGNISDPDFMQLFCGNVIIKMGEVAGQTVAIETEYLSKIQDAATCEEARMVLQRILTDYEKNLNRRSQHYSSMVDRIMEYVTDHLADQNLTLKYIAESQLYMNVDYVSRQFLKETGQRFSGYLAGVRMEKAKELLLDPETSKIRYVSEQVGCGENTQYFSQIFKKYTGITPSKWIQNVAKEG